MFTSNYSADMVKRFFLLLLLVNVSSMCIADIDPAFMDEIRNKTSSAVTKPEDLDRLLNRLRDTPLAEGADYRNKITAYQLISDSYAKRNHFRQAYTTYLQYLELKEQLFRERMTTAISTAQSSSESRQLKLTEEEKTTGEQADELLLSADRFTTSTFVYKKFFSLGIIVLTIIFAISLVRSGVRLLNMKKENEVVRNNILQLHRIALAGNLMEGNIAGNKDAVKSISQSSLEAARELSKLPTDTSLQSITKSLEKSGKSISA